VTPTFGLLDTSVVIDLHQLDKASLPTNVAISVITMTELSAGPLSTTDLRERARRLDVVQRIESLLDPIPFDITCVRAYNHIVAAAKASGKRRTRLRSNDLLIAATARALEIPLYTKNVRDFDDLTSVIDVVDLSNGH
jgi:predicted nucleic acid-binding protein